MRVSLQYQNHPYTTLMQDLLSDPLQSALYLGAFIIHALILALTILYSRPSPLLALPRWATESVAPAFSAGAYICPHQRRPPARLPQHMPP